MLRASAIARPTIGGAMSSPVSTSVSLGSGLILVEDALEGAVLCGVVGGVGLPALPDHVEPGAGEMRTAWGWSCSRVRAWR